MVEWLKTMVSNQKSEGVLDPKLPKKPSTRALKRTLLVALRCVDPNAQKRPKMGHVVHMLEADDFPFREVSFLIIKFKPIIPLGIAACTSLFWLNCKIGPIIIRG